MVNITIDGKKISAEENITIMEAAEKNGIPIPKLCYLKGINEIAACRVCVVELEGKEKLITSCNNLVKEGMVIHTNSPKVRNHRRNTVQLLLSQHDNRCVVCPRNGNCGLQQVAYDLNILEIPFKQEPEYQPWDKNFPLVRNSAKCIKCMRCVQVCDKIQGLGIWDVEGTGSRTTVNVAGHKTIGEANCALCGQCITHCPVGALSERDDTEKVWEAIENKEKIVVAQVAPAVRAAWGEELGLSGADAPVGKIFDALKRMGVDYAFDTVFSADLTIMEESTEFISRFTSGELKDRPMFTSCCPGWVRFAKSQFPYMVNYLSTAKSPQQMFGAVMKTYFAEKLGVSPDQIFTLSIMPCVAKKGEREMDLFYGEYAGHDVDAVLTTRELVKMIRSAHIRPDTLVEIPSDSPMHGGTGAGVIFGATGGVMEAALRTAVEKLSGEELKSLDFTEVRGTEGIKEASYTVNGMEIKVCVVSGLANANTIMEKVKNGTADYHFIEIMGCPGGCVNGGGQPIQHAVVRNFVDLRARRAAALYEADKDMPLRKSHESEAVKRLYAEFLGEPGSHKAHEVLHTSYVARPKYK